MGEVWLPAPSSAMAGPGPGAGAGPAAAAGGSLASFSLRSKGCALMSSPSGVVQASAYLELTPVVGSPSTLRAPLNLSLSLPQPQQLDGFAFSVLNESRSVTPLLADPPSGCARIGV